MLDNSDLEKRLKELEERAELRKRAREQKVQAETQVKTFISPQRQGNSRRLKAQTKAKVKPKGGNTFLRLVIGLTLAITIIGGLEMLITSQNGGLGLSLTFPPAPPEGDIHNPYPTSTPSGLRSIDVPWSTVQQFLSTDLTKFNITQPGYYVCVQYAMDVVNNARRAGINAYIVELIWEGQSEGHVIDAFPTTDSGTVNYDPGWQSGISILSSGAIVTIGVGEGECVANTNDCLPGSGTPYVISAIHYNVQCNWQTSQCYH